VEHAAAQESVGQLLLVIGRDHHYGALLGHDLITRLRNEEAHAIEFVQKIVGELEVRLVHLVDQQDRALLRRKRLPKRANVGACAGGDSALREVAYLVTFLDRMAAKGGVLSVKKCGSR
jgi:hypothetical protein